MPSFGPLQITKMLPRMLDITSQLLLKWDRFGPENHIDVTADFTRLTLDTLGLCSYDYRLNSFYSNEPHPFVLSMVDFLIQSGVRSRQSDVSKTLHAWSNAEYWDKIRLCTEWGKNIIEERKRHPKPETDDLLNVMLSARDEETGQGLSDDNMYEHVDMPILRA